MTKKKDPSVEEKPNIILLTAYEVGRILKLSESTIYKLSTRGELPGFKIGDSWRYELGEMIKYIKSKTRVQKDKKRGM